MKVRQIELLACDAGWRNYHFVKLTTDTGIVGWSEYDEGFGAPGVGAVAPPLRAFGISVKTGGLPSRSARQRNPSSITAVVGLPGPQASSGCSVR